MSRVKRNGTPSGMGKNKPCSKATPKSICTCCFVREGRRWEGKEGVGRDGKGRRGWKGIGRREEDERPRENRTRRKTTKDYIAIDHVSEGERERP